MNRIYLITALHASVHAPFLGSKVVVSLLALLAGRFGTVLGPGAVFPLDSAILAVTGHLARRID